MIRSPLLGTSLTFRHFGHLIVSRPYLPWLVLCHCCKQLRQKLCKHKSCFGSVKMFVQTEQDTSSRRLESRVLNSMLFSKEGCLRRWLFQKCSLRFLLCFLRKPIACKLGPKLPDYFCLAYSSI